MGFQPGACCTLDRAELILLTTAPKGRTGGFRNRRRAQDARSAEDSCLHRDRISRSWRPDRIGRSAGTRHRRRDAKERGTPAASPYQRDGAVLERD